MFVRKIDDLIGSDKAEKRTDGGSVLQGVHPLTREDRCGFSISDYSIKGPWNQDLQYKNHMEINFIVAGQVEILDLTGDKSWQITAGMIYIVGPKDRHRFSSPSDIHLISIFNPAISGTEKHDADGAFEPTGEIPPAWQGEAGRTMFAMSEGDASQGGVVLPGARIDRFRYLNRDDGCGVSVSVWRGSVDDKLWYKNHVEANYIIEGEATVEDLTTGEKWELGPGSLYVVGPSDRHSLKTKGDVSCMSVFNPPVKGDETHDADGGYPPSGEIPPAWRT